MNGISTAIPHWMRFARANPSACSQRSLCRRLLKNALFQAAMQAPTAGNQMLYTILDITDAALKARLADLCDHQPFIADAPVVLVFVADCQRWYDGFAAAGCAPRPPREGDLLLAAADAAIAAQKHGGGRRKLRPWQLLHRGYSGKLRGCAQRTGSASLRRARCHAGAGPAHAAAAGATQARPLRRAVYRTGKPLPPHDAGGTRGHVPRARGRRGPRGRGLCRADAGILRAQIQQRFFHGRCPARPRYTCAPFRRSARPARRKETRAASGGRRTAMRERTDVCGRFAPSPSGRMHLGNVFCAVLAWLSARSRGRTLPTADRRSGRPTLQARSTRAFWRRTWPGWAWIGTKAAGEAGRTAPYFQSECSELYAQALQMLK